MNKLIITMFIIGAVSFLNAQNYISIDNNGELKKDRSYLKNIYEEEYSKILNAPNIKKFSKNFKAKLKSIGQSEEEANNILHFMLLQELIYNLLEEKKLPKLKLNKNDPNYLQHKMFHPERYKD